MNGLLVALFALLSLVAGGLFAMNNNDVYEQEDSFQMIESPDISDSDDMNMQTEDYGFEMTEDNDNDEEQQMMKKQQMQNQEMKDQDMQNVEEEDFMFEESNDDNQE